MVLIRCLDHPPDDRFHEWAVAVEPIGYPETAVVCSERTHREVVAGLAFLTPAEYRNYERGQRLFSPPGTATRIGLTDRVHDLRGPRLPRPPEPPADELVDGSELTPDRLEGRTLQQLTQRVQSYLWSDHWKPTLTDHGTTWNDFLSATTAEKSVVGEWAAGDRPWDDVVERFAGALDATLR